MRDPKITLSFFVAVRIVLINKSYEVIRENSQAYSEPCKTSNGGVFT